jgi:hypothetical protein
MNYYPLKGKIAVGCGWRIIGAWTGTYSGCFGKSSVFKDGLC